MLSSARVESVGSLEIPIRQFNKTADNADRRRSIPAQQRRGAERRRRRAALARFLCVARFWPSSDGQTMLGRETASKTSFCSGFPAQRPALFERGPRHFSSLFACRSAAKKRKHLSISATIPWCLGGCDVGGTCVDLCDPWAYCGRRSLSTLTEADTQSNLTGLSASIGVICGFSGVAKDRVGDTASDQFVQILTHLMVASGISSVKLTTPPPTSSSMSRTR
jgi:hypothetical protein